MNAAQRREKILQQLHGASAPISASALAAKLGVSRQIVVGDVALLRACATIPGCICSRTTTMWSGCPTSCATGSTSVTLQF